MLNNPVILFFHFYNKKENYNLSRLNMLSKQYKFFNNSKIFF